jgi:hypothetical protein
MAVTGIRMHFSVYVASPTALIAWFHGASVAGDPLLKPRRPIGQPLKCSQGIEIAQVLKIRLAYQRGYSRRRHDRWVGRWERDRPLREPAAEREWSDAGRCRPASLCADHSLLPVGPRSRRGVLRSWSGYSPGEQASPQELQH